MSAAPRPYRTRRLLRHRYQLAAQTWLAPIPLKRPHPGTRGITIAEGSGRFQVRWLGANRVGHAWEALVEVPVELEAARRGLGGES